MVKLSRINIFTEVSELPTMLAIPHEGHLNAVCHLFNYLEKQRNIRIVFHPSYSVVDMTLFKTECKWKAFYGGAREAIPPKPLRLMERMLAYACLSTQIMQGINKHNGPEQVSLFS